MIKIPNPCREDFSKMTPTEKGRFCQKCQIDTIDFRHMSNHEIAYTLKENYGKQLCGQINLHQLEAYNLSLYPRTLPPTNNNCFRKYLLIALIGIVIASCSSNKVKLTESYNLAAFVSENSSKLRRKASKIEKKYFSLVPAHSLKMVHDCIEINEIDQIVSDVSYEVDLPVVVIKEYRSEYQVKEQRLAGEIITSHEELFGDTIFINKGEGFLKKLFRKKSD